MKLWQGVKKITFDLDTKALQTYYPKENWRNAYEDIKRHMKGCVLYALKLLENDEPEHKLSDEQKEALLRGLN